MTDRMRDRMPDWMPSLPVLRPWKLWVAGWVLFSSWAAAQTPPPSPARLPAAPPWHTPPRALEPIRAEFPTAAQRTLHQGRVVVAFTLGADGVPSELAVAESAGSPTLDRAALHSVGRARFQPALDAQGQPLTVRLRTQLDYLLELGPLSELCAGAVQQLRVLEELQPGKPLWAHVALMRDLRRLAPLSATEPLLPWQQAASAGLAAVLAECPTLPQSAAADVFQAAFQRARAPVPRAAPAASADP